MDHNHSRRAIEDINWDSAIQGRVVLLGDFNAHSPVWNPLISTRKEAGPLEQIIEDHGLILNNEPGAITRPGKTDIDEPGATTTRPKETRGTIIDLTFTTLELGPLESWAIERDNPTPSDHELIVLEWADLDISSRANRGEITGWDIDRPSPAPLIHSLHIKLPALRTPRNRTTSPAERRLTN